MDRNKKYILLILVVAIVFIVSNRPTQQKQIDNLPDGYSYKYGRPCKLTKAGEGTCNDNGTIYRFCNYDATEPCRQQH